MHGCTTRQDITRNDAIIEDNMLKKIELPLIIFFIILIIIYSTKNNDNSQLYKQRICGAKLHISNCQICKSLHVTPEYIVEDNSRGFPHDIMDAENSDESDLDY